MSKNYTQLSLEQRYQIEALLKAGIQQKLIADQLGVHASTICRELKRNIAKRGRTAGVYKACGAQRKTDLRHHQKAKQIVFTDQLKHLVAKQLMEQKWSPELISISDKMVSHERIYQWIWECKHSNKRKNKRYKKLYQYLKHGKRRRKRGNRKDNRGIIPNRISIENRPAIVKKRKRLGDIEIDLMMGKDHKGALLVATERSTLHTRLKKLAGKNSDAVARAIIKCMGKNKYKVHTLTFDNDKAFSSHEKVGEKLKAATYFTRPYTSQDKGTVENRIGVIRRFFPKKTDLRFVTDKQVEKVEKMINNRPIRKFNYLTAKQVLQKKIALIT
ncbi:MAG: IS30 family transposase [Flavisolibacter sp.]|jgi:IS30 family transposase|nr:IS30 family transposase [Flavisolibacter sp.]